MHLLPSSLFGRLVIVLLIGLLLAQLLSTIILFNDRRKTLVELLHNLFRFRLHD